MHLLQYHHHPTRQLIIWHLPCNHIKCRHNHIFMSNWGYNLLCGKIFSLLYNILCGILDQFSSIWLKFLYHFHDMKPGRPVFLTKFHFFWSLPDLHFHVIQISSLGTFPFSPDILSTFLMTCHYVKCGGVLVCTVGNTYLRLASPLSFIYNVCLPSYF